MALLKADWEFTASDFEEHPIWMSVHGHDEDEEWYDNAECDETTFRPWDESPGSLRSRLLLVTAGITLSDGRRYSGACYAGAFGSSPEVSSPAAGQATSVSDAQPRMFVSGDAICFWEGQGGVSIADRRALYEAAGGEDNVFPIAYDARSELLPEAPRGILRGFYRLQPGVEEPIVETGIDYDAEGQGPDGASVVSDKTRDEYEVLRDLRIVGKCEEALRYFDEHIRDDAGNPEWWKASAWTLEQRGNLHDALAARKERIRLLPNESANYLETCRLLFRLEEYQECLAYCDKGIAAVDRSAKVVIDFSEILEFYAARALYCLGRYEDAIERLKVLEPGFYFGRNPEPLMTRSGLIKACKAAIKSEKQSRRAQVSPRKSPKSD